MSWFFNTTEEYVLDKTPFWLLRKYEQCEKIRYNDRRAKQSDIVGAVSQVVESVLGSMFGSDKAPDYLLPSLESLVERIKEEQKPETQFVQGEWWKK